MTPETVGVPPDRIVLGKHSGRAALAHKFGEMGFELSADEINRVYQAFVRLADGKKHINHQDLLSLLSEERAEISTS